MSVGLRWGLLIPAFSGPWYGNGGFMFLFPSWWCCCLISRAKFLSCLVFFFGFHAVVGRFFDEKSASYMTLFISGFMTAILSKEEKYLKDINWSCFFRSFLFAVCLVVIRHVYNPVVAISLTPMFLSIASGFSIFGLLANENFNFWVWLVLVFI